MRVRLVYVFCSTIGERRALLLATAHGPETNARWVAFACDKGQEIPSARVEVSARSEDGAAGMDRPRA